MRDLCTPQMVAILARAAGFEFTPERCELLAPQLDWMLAQAELLAGLNLETEEPDHGSSPGFCRPPIEQGFGA